MKMSLSDELKRSLLLCCTACKMEFPLESFAPIPGKGLRSGCCLSCRQEGDKATAVQQLIEPLRATRVIEEARERAREWARLHPEQVLANGRAWRTRLLNGALDKLGGRCVCCGETERGFLQIDHIHGDGSKDEGRKSPQAFYRHVIENEEPGIRLRLLCANCHFAHSYRGGCPHELARAAERLLSA